LFLPVETAFAGRSLVRLHLCRRRERRPLRKRSSGAERKHGGNGANAKHECSLLTGR
jgi:hypothetical protein